MPDDGPVVQLVVVEVAAELLLGWRTAGIKNGPVVGAVVEATLATPHTAMQA